MRQRLAAGPLLFEENRGQGPADARFLVRGPGYSATLAPRGFRLRSSSGAEATVSFRGASDAAAAQVSGLEGSISYLKGRDPDLWAPGVPRYRRVGFREVYPGVDVVYYTAEGELEYDFSAAPGAQVDAIRMDIGSAAPELTPRGDLLLRRDGATFTLRRPIAYQGGGDHRTGVAAAYRLHDDGSVGFELEDYDPTRPLTIDPRVGLSTYLGGDGEDRVTAVQVDEEGSVWVAGFTTSTDFPLPENAFPVPARGNSDVFISKLERDVDSQGGDGWRIAATILLGGANQDRVVDFELGADGEIYVFGDTRSTDFPVSTDAEQPQIGGGRDFFFAVLDESEFPFLTDESRPAQNLPPSFEVEYATYVGGSADERASQGFRGPFVEEAPACSALVGSTDSADYPVTLFAEQLNKSGGADAALTVICRDPSAADAHRTVYATFLGGTREEAQVHGGVTEDGAYCLGMRTSSDDLSAVAGLQPDPGGSTDIFLGCWAPVRTRFGLPFVYRDLGTTYFGGELEERFGGMIVRKSGPKIGGLDPQIDVYVALSSDAVELGPPPAPVPPGGMPPPPEVLPEIPEGASETNPGSRSIFFAVFDGFMTERFTQFWIGGSTPEEVTDFRLAGDCVALVGRSSSADFPVSETFPQRLAAGADDAMAAKFCFDENRNATTEYAGLYGSPVDDEALAVAMSPDGFEVVAGAVSALTAFASVSQAGDLGFPTLPGSPQRSFGGGSSEGFVIELFRPRFTAENMVGAADFRGGAVAPGQILSLFGEGYGPDELLVAQPDSAGRFPRRIGPTRVLFNGSPAPLLFTSKDQVNLVAPLFLDGRTSVEVEVEVDGAASRTLTAAVAPTAPGVFTIDQSGAGQGAILNQDFSVNGRANPAAPGSVVQIFLSGAGRTNPPGVDGEIAPVSPLARLAAPVLVRIGGVQATVLYAGSAPGLTNGLAQINVVVPSELTRDLETAIQIAIGGLSIQEGVTMAIR